MLTAGHCINGTSASFTLNGLTVGSASVLRHPGYCGGECNDVALITLSHDLAERPTPISAQTPTAGQAIVLVGFGVTGAGTGSFGTKRRANDVIDTVNASTFLFGASGSTCTGDSGGPSLSQVEGVEAVVGVHSTATITCASGRDMRVDIFASWIESSSGGDVAVAGRGDAGSEIDAGQGLDAGQDAGVAARDAGSTPQDAGGPPYDAGLSPFDAGAPTTDASSAGGGGVNRADTDPINGDVIGGCGCTSTSGRAAQWIVVCGLCALRLLPRRR